MRVLIKTIPGAVFCTVVMLYCACSGHVLPQSPLQQKRPLSDNKTDSVGRTAKKIMNNYFFVIDSSMKSDPFGFDSIKLPDVDYTVKNSTRFK
jgi:hypothetical protein